VEKTDPRRLAVVMVGGKDLSDLENGINRKIAKIQWDIVDIKFQMAGSDLKLGYSYTAMIICARKPENS
jgi:predicted amino acid-binding ACT domain protein